MDIQEYSRLATAFALDSVSNDQTYACLGLISELGEVADKVKKQIRDREGLFTENFKNTIAYELGDCFWYINAICYTSKLEFNESALDIGDDKSEKINYSCRTIGYKVIEAASFLKFDLFEGNGTALIDQAIIDGMLGLLSDTCYILELPVGLVLQLNIDKLTGRKQHNTLSGDGDNR